MLDIKAVHLNKVYGATDNDNSDIVEITSYNIVQLDLFCKYNNNNKRGRSSEIPYCGVCNRTFKNRTGFSQHACVKSTS